MLTLCADTGQFLKTFAEIAGKTINGTVSNYRLSCSKGREKQAPAPLIWFCFFLHLSRYAELTALWLLPAPNGNKFADSHAARVAAPVAVSGRWGRRSVLLGFGVGFQQVAGWDTAGFPLSFFPFSFTEGLNY